MADSRVNRKVTYRLYPTRAQEERLLWMLDRHRWLYNAALEHRITAWRRAGKTVSYAQQCKELTAIRADDEDYAGINAQSLQVTLKRLDLAFQHFFQRVRQGQTPGFPRFKGKSRFHSFGYKSHGDGWKLLLPEKTEAEKHRPRTGRIRISGVGLVRMRGRDRNGGVPKTCEIRRRNGKWYASVTFACTPVRERGTEEAGLDWGTKAFATVVTGSGETLTIDNPRHLAEAEERLTRAQQILSRKTKGSNSWRKANLRLARLHEKVQNRRDDFLHKTSAALISRFARIATEELAVANMTRSARGTMESPGRNVAQKAGLNRSILDTAPARFHAMLRTKAEEAGSEVVEAPTRTLRPTQRCHACWQLPERRKTLSERTHACGCGTTCDRDENAARVLLRWMQELDGARDGPAGRTASAARLETPCAAA